MADVTAAKLVDRVIFERGDGLYDVENVSAPGKLETARPGGLPGLKSLHEAHEIALGHMKTGGRVWVRHHHTPNSIELYRP